MRRNRILILLALAVLAQCNPAPTRAWSWDGGHLTPARRLVELRAVELPRQADLDRDGQSESMLLEAGRAHLFSGPEIRWSSPADWQVAQAAFGDLDRDDQDELILLVWRPFHPWPVDQFLPYGGRIADFHDEEGRSCHLILIGWQAGRLVELWAGSALVEPLLAFAPLDLDGDGRQELVTVDAEYGRSGAGRGKSLAIWEWNGFGFTIVDRLDGQYSSLALARQNDGQVLILTP